MQVTVTTSVDKLTQRECVVCPQCKTIVLLTTNAFLMICPNPTCRAELMIATPLYQRGEPR